MSELLQRGYRFFPFHSTIIAIYQLSKFSSIVLSGGPNSVYVENAPPYDPEIFSGQLPVAFDFPSSEDPSLHWSFQLLGICYGFQLINKHFGGTVGLQPRREDGRTKIKVDIIWKNNHYNFSLLGWSKVAVVSWPGIWIAMGVAHSRVRIKMKNNRTYIVPIISSDGVTAGTVAREGFRVNATSGEFVSGQFSVFFNKADDHSSGIEHPEKRIYGLQFHPGSLEINNFCDNF
jgi:GMP synthase-like glutamine amidotransferase